jgi:hypothetical protein
MAVVLGSGREGQDPSWLSSRPTSLGESSFAPTCSDRSSRRSFSEVFRRHKEMGDGEVHLSGPQCRWRPERGTPEMVSWIASLPPTHHYFGCQRMAMPLSSITNIGISRSGVSRILKNLETSRLLALHRLKRRAGSL